MDQQIFVGVSTSFKGTHSWPEASSFAGDQVKFLEDRHRHTFYVDVEMEVFHDDRDVEFFVLQSQVNQAIKSLYETNYDGIVYNLGRRSCETIALEILAELRKVHPNAGDIEIRVSEDNEVWARLKDRTK